MQVLVRLAKRSVVSPAASDEMIAILQQQYFNERHSAQLPAVSEWRIKPADRQVYHDAAIVYPPQHTPYVVVILTSGLSEKDEAPALVAALSAAIYHN